VIEMALDYERIFSGIDELVSIHKDLNVEAVLHTVSMIVAIESSNTVQEKVRARLIVRKYLRDKHGIV